MLEYGTKPSYTFGKAGVWRGLVTHVTRDDGVEGSYLLTPTIFKLVQPGAMASG